MVIDLAEHADDGFISLKDIAARQGLSKKYLEQIVPLLNKTGMLSTTRGYQGGIRLAGAGLRPLAEPVAPSRGQSQSQGCGGETCATLHKSSPRMRSMSARRSCTSV